MKKNPDGTFHFTKEELRKLGHESLSRGVSRFLFEKNTYRVDRFHDADHGEHGGFDCTLITTAEPITLNGAETTVEQPLPPQYPEEVTPPNPDAPTPPDHAPDAPPEVHTDPVKKSSYFVSKGSKHHK